MATSIEVDHDSYVPKCNGEDGSGSLDGGIVQASPSMDYSEFFEEFLIPNRSCIFDTAITGEWPSRRNWNANDAPNFEWLKRCFGDCKVPIADCNKRYYNAQQKDNMLIRSYLDYWIDYRNCNYPNKMPLLYLKDWHCIKTHSDVSIYDVPKYFASDWLNEYYTAHPNLNDDYMFVYMGPKGTWTPFHVDVFTSYSWSANIVGKKRWLLFPPGQENHLRNENGDLVYDVASMDLDNNRVISNWDNSNNQSSLKSFEVIQEPGQILFVPSGWHHQVWNLEDTISINHNWLNGCNIGSVWNSIKRELTAVMREIEDCREMDDWSMHCQVMLKASFGMDYFQFYDLLSFVAEKRLNSVINSVPVKSFEKWLLGKNHCLFDLRQIKNVLEKLVHDSRAKKIDVMLWKNNEAQLLLNEITKLL